MDPHDIPTYWPVDEIRRQDLDFYQQATESYLPDNHVEVAGAGPMLMLGSYSYLGLNGDARINQAAQEAIEKYGTGTIGVRLLAGTLDIHHRLEERVASFKSTQSAVTFSSGFMANISTIAAVAGRNDVVIYDKLNHASIVDGCQISQAELVRFRHNDMAHLEACLEKHRHRERKLVVVDGVFSMDGDIINLPEVSRLCRKYEALVMVDEAHSLGVLGATGHGIEEHFGLSNDAVDIKMGTLSKAIPSVGGYVATSERIAKAIQFKARAFIYSAAPPPASAAAAIAAMDVIEAEPERVKRLHDNIDYFRSSLLDVGFECPKTGTAIFPIVCGDDWMAFRLARYCQKRGVYVQAIPHPVVPKGSARLRACVTADHMKEDLKRGVSVICEGAQSLGILGLHPQEGEVESAGDIR
jgi:glycine C-acetyltransferase